MFSRRQFLWTLTASGVLFERQLLGQQSGARTFQYGVASGDPLHDRVVLWTRVTPSSGVGNRVDVRWRIGTDPTLERAAQTGMTSTSSDRDYTVKVDASGLKAGTPYYFAFEANGERSPIGRTRTAPNAPVARLRFVTVSCANYPAGYFNAYRAIANRSDIDAVIHLGDYIYEYANGEYGDGTALSRLPRPIREIVSLQDYRQRYATYRSDPDLQEVHRLHPFIAVWDDHEIANNTWSGGAQNHNAERGEGDWATRRAAAYRAYLEWMPIREQGATSIRLYRSFGFGTLADVVMLDTRSLRDRQVDAADARALASPGRRLLGAAQEQWFLDTLRASQRTGNTWRIIGQQVMFSPLAAPGRPVLDSDAWDGYQAERDRLLGALQDAQIKNVVLLTGDMHSSWALEVPRDPWATARSGGTDPLAVELIGPAVSSPPAFSAGQARTVVPQLRSTIPHLKFLDGLNRGYLLIELTAERMRADWYFTADVLTRSDREERGASFVCERGVSRLMRV